MDGMFYKLYTYLSNIMILCASQLRSLNMDQKQREKLIAQQKAIIEAHVKQDEYQELNDLLPFHDIKEEEVQADTAEVQSDALSIGFSYSGIKIYQKEILK
jgi:hypothetical protein